MPVARFQMPDGRIGRFEVPEGTTPEQAQSLIEQHLSSTKTEKTQPEEQPKGMWQKVKDAFSFSAKGETKRMEMFNEASAGMANAPELALRTTADYPLGATQAIVASQPKDTKIPLTPLGSWGPISDITTGDLSQSIANVTQDTNQVQEQVPGGMIVRGGVQALQIPVPAKWVSEGKMLVQTIKAGGTSIAAGAVGGYVQPQAAINPEERQAARKSSAVLGAGAGGVLGLGTSLGGTGYKLYRDYFTKEGAKDVLAQDLTKALGPKADQAIGTLDARMAEVDAMNASLLPDEQYKPTTNSILDMPELDTFNRKANRLDQESLVPLANQQQQNTRFVTEQTDKFYNPNATTENLKAQAKAIVDDPVDVINTAKKIVADKKLTNEEARAEQGKLIKKIYKTQDEANETIYSKIGTKDVQPDDIIKGLDDAIAEDAGVKGAISRNPNLKDLYEAKPKPPKATGVLDANGNPVMGAQEAAKPINVQKIRKANAELSGEIIKAEDAGKYELAYQLEKVKKGIQKYMLNHPDPQISSAAQEASDFYAKYQATLRRADNSPSSTQVLGRDLKSNKVVNESDIPGRFYDKSKGASGETIEDMQRLIQHGEDTLGIPNQATDTTRQVLYSNLKQFMRNNPTPSKIDNWMVDNETTFEKFPALQKEFTTLRDEILAKSPEIGLSNKMINPEGAFNDNATFRSWIGNPDTMDTALAIAQGDKSGKAVRELQDSFAQFMKDTTTKLDEPTSQNAFRALLNPDTTQGKSVKALFQNAPDEYKHYTNMAKVMKEMGQDFTFSPAARAGGRDVPSRAGQLMDIGASSQGWAAVRTAKMFRDYITDTNKYLSVVDEMRRDPKFAKELLEYAKSGDATKHAKTVAKIQAVTSGRAGIAGGSMGAVDASEGQTEQTPRYTPNDLELLEKNYDKDKFKSNKRKSDTPSGVSLAPQSFKLPDRYKDNPMAAETAKTVAKYAQKHGVPVDRALMLVDSESSMGTNAKKNPKSSAQGEFQLTDAARKDVEKTLGRKLDMSKKEDRIEGGILYQKQVADGYRKAFGKDPETWEVKAMYQLGEGGFKRLKSMSDQKVPAWQSMEAAAHNHKELFFAGDKALSPSQVLRKFEKKYKNANEEFKVAGNE